MQDMKAQYASNMLLYRQKASLMASTSGPSTSGAGSATVSKRITPIICSHRLLFSISLLFFQQEKM
jgi:hypothetical protein